VKNLRFNESISEMLNKVEMLDLHSARSAKKALRGSAAMKVA